MTPAPGRPRSPRPARSRTPPRSHVPASILGRALPSPARLSPLLAARADEPEIKGRARGRRRPSVSVSRPAPPDPHLCVATHNLNSTACGPARLAAAARPPRHRDRVAAKSLAFGQPTRRSLRRPVSRPVVFSLNAHMSCPLPLNRHGKRRSPSKAHYSSFVRSRRDPRRSLSKTLDRLSPVSNRIACHNFPCS